MDRFECVFNDGECVARQFLLIPREMNDGFDCDDEQRESNVVEATLDGLLPDEIHGLGV